MPIIQKTFDMLLWLIPKLDKFPRKQKFILGERIEIKALDFIGLLQKTRYVSSKKTDVLLEAHIAFEQFKTLIRLALGLNLLSSKSYRHLSQYIAEIGRMLGGWIKSA